MNETNTKMRNNMKANTSDVKYQIKQLLGREIMEIYSVKDKPLPIGRRILVYGFNIDNPRWLVDEFAKHGKSDHYQLNGNLYPHNISHWAELPDKPDSDITPLIK